MQNWAAEQTHLPKQYYQGLLPVLQSCPDVASILALTSQLWQSGMLRMLCNAYTASLQQQASTLALLQGGGSSAANATALAQLSSLLAAATGGVGGTDMTAALAGMLQQPGMAQLLGALGGPAAGASGFAAPPPPMPAPAASAPPPPAGRPVRQAAGRLARAQHTLGHAHPGESPAAKRSRRQGDSGPNSEEPPPPPQLQQLLDILSGEEEAAGEEAAEEAAGGGKAAAAAAVPVKGEPTDGQQQLPSLAAVSAFAAAAEQRVAPPPPAPAATAPAALAVQRSLSLQRSLSSSLPLPANQPNVLIVPAVPAPEGKPGEQAGGEAGGGGGKPPVRANVGGKSIELTITAPSQLQQTAPFAAPRGGGAIITTGLNPGSGGAGGTSAAPAGASPRACSAVRPVGGGGAGSGPMVSAFAAAAATLPAAPVPAPQRSKAVHPWPLPPRALSTPATITTGITAPSRSAVRSRGRSCCQWWAGGWTCGMRQRQLGCVGLLSARPGEAPSRPAHARVACHSSPTHQPNTPPPPLPPQHANLVPHATGGLDVLSRAASLQPSSESVRAGSHPTPQRANGSSCGDTPAASEPPPVDAAGAEEAAPGAPAAVTAAEAPATADAPAAPAAEPAAPSAEGADV